MGTSLEVHARKIWELVPQNCRREREVRGGSHDTSHDTSDRTTIQDFSSGESRTRRLNTS